MRVDSDRDENLASGKMGGVLDDCGTHLEGILRVFAWIGAEETTVLKGVTTPKLGEDSVKTIVDDEGTVYSYSSEGWMKPDDGKSFERQVGGNHYAKYPIQPTEYIIRNGLNFCEGNIVKYVTRWKDKGGVEDLKKARHYLDMMIEEYSK